VDGVVVLEVLGWADGEEVDFCSTKTRFWAVRRDQREVLACQ